ncbi:MULTISPECIES: hypothetical protein [Shinella]|jgi:hypothetical protein|uniref:hypothetical protein n=1 Tax=Shinella TaxID=323620 RepID=UPI001F1AE9F0|nr:MULTISPECIES: hypothetical protein [Shinella]
MSRKIPGIDSIYRMERAALSSPIPEMTEGLIAKHITPVTEPGILRMHYPKTRTSESDVVACMRHACRAYTRTIGSVLVVTDHLETLAFGTAEDLGLDLDTREMQPALKALINSIDPDHLATTRAARNAEGSSKVEYPIYAMPAYPYAAQDGKLVATYGTYLASFRL